MSYQFYRVCFKTSFNGEKYSKNNTEGFIQYTSDYAGGFKKLEELGLEGWQIVTHSECNDWETYTLQRRIGNPIEKAQAIEV